MERFACYGAFCTANYAPVCTKRVCTSGGGATVWAQWEEDDGCPTVNVQCPDHVPVKRYVRLGFLALFFIGVLYTWLRNVFFATTESTQPQPQPQLSSP